MDQVTGIIRGGGGGGTPGFLIPNVICDEVNFSSMYVVSDATKRSLRHCKFQNFPGGGICPQTPLIRSCYRTL